MLKAAKEFLVKLLVVALELSGLSFVVVNDFLKQCLASSLTFENLIEFLVNGDLAHGTENSVGSVSLGFVELNLLLESVDFVLDLDHKKSGVGEIGEGKCPSVEVTKKLVILFHITLHGNETGFMGTDDLEVKGGGVNFLKLKSKLVGISEIELYKVKNKIV